MLNQLMILNPAKRVTKAWLAKFARAFEQAVGRPPSEREMQMAEAQRKVGASIRQSLVLTRPMYGNPMELGDRFIVGVRENRSGVPTDVESFGDRQAAMQFVKEYLSKRPLACASIRDRITRDVIVYRRKFGSRRIVRMDSFRRPGIGDMMGEVRNPRPFQGGLESNPAEMPPLILVGDGYNRPAYVRKIDLFPPSGRRARQQLMMYTKSGVPYSQLKSRHGRGTRMSAGEYVTIARGNIARYFHGGQWHDYSAALENPGAQWHFDEAGEAMNLSAKYPYGSPEARYHLGRYDAHTHSEIEARRKRMNPAWRGGWIVEAYNKNLGRWVQRLVSSKKKASKLADEMSDAGYAAVSYRKSSLRPSKMSPDVGVENPVRGAKPNPAVDEAYMNFHGAFPSKSREVRVPDSFPKKLWLLGEHYRTVLKTGEILSGGYVAAGTGNTIYLLNVKSSSMKKAAGRVAQIEYTPRQPSDRHGATYYHTYKSPPRIRRAAKGFYIIRGARQKLTSRGIIG